LDRKGEDIRIKCVAEDCLQLLKCFKDSFKLLKAFVKERENVRFEALACRLCFLPVSEAKDIFPPYEHDLYVPYVNITFTYPIRNPLILTKEDVLSNNQSVIYINVSEHVEEDLLGLVNVLVHKQKNLIKKIFIEVYQEQGIKIKGIPGKEEKLKDVKNFGLRMKSYIYIPSIKPKTSFEKADVDVFLYRCVIYPAKLVTSSPILLFNRKEMLLEHRNIRDNVFFGFPLLGNEHSHSAINNGR